MIVSEGSDSEAEEPTLIFKEGRASSAEIDRTSIDLGGKQSCGYGYMVGYGYGYGYGYDGMDGMGLIMDMGMDVG